MEQHLKNQENFNSGVVSIDLEHVKASYYDVMRMAGKIVISKDSQPYSKFRAGRSCQLDLGVDR